MDLLYTIGADATNFNQNVKGLGQTAQTASNQVTQSLAQAAQATTNLGGSAISASMKFQQMRSGLSALRDGTLAFAVGGQRADMMLMAMGHHITSLVNETGSLQGAFKALGSSLLGPGGVILGLTVAYELFKHFEKGEKEAYDATKNFTDAQDAQKQIVNNLQDSYGKAVSDVQELTTNIKLAKEGFINKNEVVKEYNDTLGKTMGAVKTLNEVEQKLISGAPDYIKMMLYKAAAQTALKEASDKAIEAAKVQLKPQEEFKPNAFTQFALRSGTMAPGGVPGNAPVSAAESQKKIADIAEENRAKEKKKFENDQNDLLKIFNDFQTKAAKIAEDHKWTFIDPEKAKKSKEALDGLAKLEKELKDAETVLSNSIIAGKTSPEDATSPLVRRVDAATEAIRKFKANIAEALGGINTLNSEITKIKTTESGNYLQVVSENLSDNSVSKNTDKSVKKGQALEVGGEVDNDIIAESMQKVIDQYKKLADDKIRNAAQTRIEAREATRYNSVLRELQRTFGQGFEQAFEGALSGAQNFFSAMGNFLVKLVEQLLGAIAEALVLAAILSLVGGGSFVGSLLGSGSKIGTLQAATGIKGYATGGIFTQAHAGVFGEAGPEAIVTPKHLQEFAGVSGNNGNMHVSFDPIMTGPVLNYKARVRSDKYIRRTS